MSNGAYAGLRMAARAAMPDPETDPNETEPDNDEDDASPADGKTKDKTPMDTNCNASALAQAKAEGFAEANARFNTVLASDQYAGRELLAKTLLGNDKLSADEIVTALAAAPKIEASPLASADADDGLARADMRAALAAEQPAATAAEGSDDTTPEDDSLVKSMAARFSTAK